LKANAFHSHRQIARDRIYTVVACGDLAKGVLAGVDLARFEFQP